MFSSGSSALTPLDSWIHICTNLISHLEPKNFKLGSKLYQQQASIDEDGSNHNVANRWQNRAGKNLSRIDCDVVARLRIWFKDGTVDAIIHGSPNIEPSPTSTAHIITLFSLPVNILKSYTSCQHGAISFSIRDSIIKTNEWSSWSHILWHGYSVVCLINRPKPKSRRREVIPPRTARSRW